MDASSIIEKIVYLNKKNKEKDEIIKQKKRKIKELLEKITKKGLSENEQKNSLTLIKTLRKQKESIWFNDPVDPIAQGIPNYFKIIKNPMDFGTIEKKLKNSNYQSFECFIADVRLVFSNCRTFNPPNSDVCLAATVIEKLFEQKIAKLTKDSGSNQSSKRNSPDITEEDLFKKRQKTSSPAAQEIDKKRRPKLSKSMGQCSMLLKEIMGKKYADFSWPFLEPVDAEKLNLVDYHDIVKQPMDLGTVNQKLSSGKYQTVNEFASDVHLIFSNCIKYNTAEHEISKLGMNLQEIFDQKMKRILNNQVYEETAGVVDGGNQETDNENDEYAEKDKSKEKQEKQPTKEKKNSSKEKNADSYSYEEKLEMTNHIANFKEEQIKDIIGIIRTENPDIGTTGEIEINFDSLGTKTLKKLMKYVKSQVKKGGLSSSTSQDLSSDDMEIQQKKREKKEGDKEKEEKKEKEKEKEKEREREKEREKEKEKEREKEKEKEREREREREKQREKETESERERIDCDSEEKELDTKESDFESDLEKKDNSEKEKDVKEEKKEEKKEVKVVNQSSWANLDDSSEGKNNQNSLWSRFQEDAFLKKKREKEFQSLEEELKMKEQQKEQERKQKKDQELLEAARKEEERKKIEKERETEELRRRREEARRAREQTCPVQDVQDDAPLLRNFERTMLSLSRT